jgi:hypothetical protein
LKEDPKMETPMPEPQPTPDPIPPEGWILLHPSRKPGRLLYVRRSSVIAIERDAGRDHTLIRLVGSSYMHIVVETPEEIIGLLGERR